MQKDGAGKTLQDFTSFPPARCCPVKARSQPAVRDPVPKRSSASRNGAWVPTRGGGWPPWGLGTFPGLPAGSGCDITGRRKTLGPGFLYGNPGERRSAAAVPAAAIPELRTVPAWSLAWTFFLLTCFYFFLSKNIKRSGGIWGWRRLCRGTR